MDTELRGRLRKIEEQIEKLKPIERRFLYLDAHREAMQSQIFLKTDGKTVKEREAKALASEDWTNFTEGWVESKSEYNHEKRLLELKLKAFDATYLSYKVDGTAIRRQGGTA